MAEENMAEFIDALSIDREPFVAEDDLKEGSLRFQAEKLSDEDLGNVSAGVDPLPSPPADIPCPAPADEAQQTLQTLQQVAQQTAQLAQQAQQDIQQLMQQTNTTEP